MPSRNWDRLGAEYPVFAFTHSHVCCAEVSRAGGVGVLGGTSHTPEQLDEELTWIERHVDGRPFGVDLLVPATLAGASNGQVDRDRVQALVPEEHRKQLDELLDSRGVPELPEDAEWPGAAMMMTEDPAEMVSLDRIRELVEVTLAHPGVKLFASALGLPPAEVTDRMHERGIAVAALGGAPEHAAKHVDAGIDLIIAQGTEAGGHCGEVTTMVLVPQMVEAAGDVPVLAAGGIAHGSQLVAALAMGAAGVWTGSMWLLADEAVTTPAERRLIREASSRDTVRSRSRTGKPCRMLRSEFTDFYDDPENPDPLPMPLQLELASKPLARVLVHADRGDEGANRLLTSIAGQVVGMLDEERPTAEIMRRFIAEAREALGALGDRPDLAWAKP